MAQLGERGRLRGVIGFPQITNETPLRARLSGEFLCLVYLCAQTKLVSPSGRDVAQRQRGLVPVINSLRFTGYELVRLSPLSHLPCKCQLSRRESQEAGANCTPDESRKLSYRLVRVLLLPSRLVPRHLLQRGRLWFSAQPKLVSPFGRDVAQRQRGQAPL